MNILSGLNSGNIDYNQSLNTGDDVSFDTINCTALESLGYVRSSSIVTITETGDLDLRPISQGTAGQVLMSSGGGTVNFQDIPVQYDQSLNTNDTPTFANIFSTILPSINNHVANKNYVDTALNGKLNLSGGTMSGAINHGGFSLNNTSSLNQNLNSTDTPTFSNVISNTPTISTHLCNKNYVDTALSGKLNLSGGTMSGLLNFGGLALTNTSTLNQSLNTTSSPTFVSATFNGTVDAGVNVFTSSAIPTANTHLTNKLYIDTGLNTKLSLSGGTMTGDITTLRTNDTRIGLGNGVVIPSISTDTIQIGANAGKSTIANNCICIGKLCCNSANPIGVDSVSVGRDCGLSFGVGASSISIGKASSGSGTAAICIGEDSLTLANGSIAIGKLSTALNANGIAIGQASTSNNINSMVFNANGSTVGQTTANNQIVFIAGTTVFRYDSTGFNVMNAASSTSTSSGSLRCSGGLGVAENLNVGGNSNLPTVNNRVPSTGFFYQTGNLDVVISTTNVETEITSDIGVGTRTFTVAEMYVGASFAITLGGTLNTANKENLQLRFYLDDPTLVLPTILFFDSGAMEISDTLGVNNQFKFLAEFSLRSSGSLSSIYSNNQLLYARDITENSFRGQSKWQLATNCNLSIPRKLRITATWTSALGVHNFINRLVRINRVY